MHGLGSCAAQAALLLRAWLHHAELQQIQIVVTRHNAALLHTQWVCSGIRCRGAHQHMSVFVQSLQHMNLHITLCPAFCFTHSSINTSKQCIHTRLLSHSTAVVAAQCSRYWQRAALGKLSVDAAQCCGALLMYHLSCTSISRTLWRRLLLLPPGHALYCVCCCQHRMMMVMMVMT